jgi:hypothetical protein
MNIFVQAEVHFHQQEQLSVYLESNSCDDAERLGEIGLFTLLALRMMSNLDVCNETDMMAQFLMVAGKVIVPIATGQATGGFQLVPYPGYGGRKQFISKLHLTDEQTRFDLDVNGFDAMATGVAYYGPMAVQGVLRHLAIKRAHDAPFLERLGAAAALCGQAQLERRITLENRTQLGFVLLMATCRDYFE